MNNHNQVLYTSFISPDFNDVEVPDIVRRAREKNRLADVTGLLIFDGLCFCQYLEGPDHALERVFASIKADSRHLEITVKEHTSLIGHRMFASSPLAFAACDDPDRLDALRKFDPKKSERSAIAMLEQLLPMFSIEPGN